MNTFPTLRRLFPVLCLFGAAWLRAQEPLAHLTYSLQGARLDVSPAAVTVPEGVAGSVSVTLNRPELGGGAYVEATLRGPSFPARRLLALPGQPLVFPPLNLAGDYQLDRIRLVDAVSGETRLEGSPASVPVRVIGQVLVSRMTSRVLSLEEIQEKGIVIDESSFRAVEFEVAFVVDGESVTIGFPVVSPTFRDVTEVIPAAEVRERLAQADAINRALARAVTLPPELDSAGLNLEVTPINFQVVADEGDPNLSLRIPPIPALLVVPGRIGFLNQFFSVMLFTQNAAPDGSGLSVRDLSASMTLPKGADQVPGTHATPGDDPLRFARVGASAQILNPLPVRHPGPDGTPGTADDLARLQPGQTGQAEFLVEGLREGLHVMDVVIDARLDGLAAGSVAIQGRAAGSVLVRNPAFSMAFTHPRTVRAGEPYEASVTLLNIGQSTANLTSVSLAPASISGAALLSPETVDLGNIAPGQSVTATYRLLAQRTGRITFSNLSTDDGLIGRFRLKMGVDERGVELSPDALALPDYVGELPASVLAAATRVLGQALSASTAPRLPPGVLAVRRGILEARAIELAEAGQRLAYGDDLARVMADLALDWLGARAADAGFAQILSSTDAGGQFRQAVAEAREAADGLDSPDALEHVLPALAGRGEAWRLFAVDGNGASLRALEPATPHWSATNGLWFAAAATHEFHSWTAATNTTPAAFVAAEVFTNGTARLREWALPALDPGDRLSWDPSDPSTLRMDRGGDGGVDQTLAAGRSATVLEAPPAVVSARQDTTVLSGRPDPSCFHIPYLNYGTVLALLFNKPMSQENLSVAGAFLLDNGIAAQSVRVQPGGRVALVNLRQPVGLYRARQLTVNGVADARGGVILNQSLAVALNADLGSPLRGRVARADGSPAGGVPVTLTFRDLLSTQTGCQTTTRRVSQVRTASDGTFTFDFVMASVPYTISATDTFGMQDAAAAAIADTIVGAEPAQTVLEQVRESNAALDQFLSALGVGSFQEAVAVVEGVDRAVLNDLLIEGSSRIGAEVTIALRFRGRGEVAGVVRDESGNPIGGAAVNLFPNAESRELGRGVFTSADGRFTFVGVPLGNYTVEATDALRRTRTVSGFIQALGQRDEVEVVLVSGPPAVFSSLQGRTLEADGITPHSGARVVIGRWLGDQMFDVQAVVESDGQGFWSASSIQVGARDVAAVSRDGARRAVRAGMAVSAGVTNTVVLTFPGTLAVQGRVLYSDNRPVANALVSGGESLVRTAPDGTFSLTGVPPGRRNFSAGLEADPLNGRPFTRIGSASSEIVPGLENFVTIRFDARASLRGQVRDVNGDPVPNIRVVIPQPAAGGFYHTQADARGFYRFDNLGLGSYTVSSPGPDVSTRTAANIEALGNQAIQSIREGASEEEIAAALGNLFAAYAGVDDPLVMVDRAPFNPVTWGYNKGALTFDDQVLNVDIRHLAQGSVSGQTINGDGVPVGARVRLTGLGPDAYGAPGFIVRGERDTDPATGAFHFGGQIFAGAWGLQAATPFSPVIISTSGYTTLEAPDATGIVLQFPPEESTNGRLVGTVFQPGGALPVGSNVTVKISFGDLEIRTRADGTYDTQLDIPAGGYRVEAEDPVSGLRGVAYGGVAAGHTNRIDVTLLGEGDLDILVVNASGSPVSGATLEIRGARFPFETAAGVTGPDGRLRVFDLAEGSYGVCARAVVGIASVAGRSGGVVTRDGSGEVRVVLGATGAIQGRFLTADGFTPVPFANVSVGSLGFAVTGTNGFFSVTDVPLGTYELRAIDPLNGLFARAFTTLSTNLQTNRVDLIQQSLGELSGTVYNSYRDGVVSGAEVRFSSADPMAESRHATTGPDGRFVFPGAAPGGFVVRALDPARRLSGQTSGTLPAGQNLGAEVYIQALGRLTVTVLEPDGITPAALANVSFAGPGRTADTDASGQVRFEDLVNGRFPVTARSLAPGQGASRASASVTLTGYGEYSPVTLVLSGTGEVAGRSLQADGVSPAPGAEVRLVMRDGTDLGTQVTGPGGEFEYLNTPVGDFTLTGVLGNLAGRVGGSVTGAGHRALADLTLGASVTVTGRVVRADGTTPMVGEPMALLYTPTNRPPGQLSFITDVVGGFQFLDIPTGRLDLEILVPALGGVARLTTNALVNLAVVDSGLFVLDEADPRVVSVSPADGSQGIPITTSILLDFSEDITRVDQGGVYLTLDGVQIPGVAALENDGGNLPRRVRWTPAQPLLSTSTYEILAIGGDRFNAGGGLVARGVVDKVGKPLLNTFRATFTTRDDDPPLLVSNTPAPGAEQVDPASVIRLSFNEPIQPNAVITVTGPGGAVAGSVSYGLGNLVAVFTPTVSLPINAGLNVSVSGVRDLADNPLAGQPLNWSFQSLDTLGPDIAQVRIKNGVPPLAGQPVEIEAVLAASEAGVSVRMSADLVVFGQSSPGDLDLPYTLPTSGSLVFRAVAIDRFGNEGPLAEFPVTIQANQPPTVQVVRVSPVSGPVITGQNFVFDVLGADDVAVTRLLYSVGGAASLAPRVFNGNSTRVSVPVGGSIGASVTVTAQAEDAAGLFSSTAVLTVPVADGQAPQVAIVSPLPPVSVQVGATVPVLLSAQDPFGVQEIRLELSGAVTQSIVIPVSPAVTNVEQVVNVQIPPGLRPGGQGIQVSASARDTSGFSRTSPAQSWTIQDGGRPTIALLDPTGVPLVNPGTSLPVSVRVTDDVGVTTLTTVLTGAVVTNLVQNFVPPATNQTFNFSVPLPATVVGNDFFIHAVATDGLGQAVTSLTERVEVSVEDLDSPVTRVTSVSSPGSGSNVVVSFTVDEGLADLAYVALYFRRDGKGGFLRYCPDGHLDGRFLPTSGANGSIGFNSEHVFGDGTYEFFSVGVDLAGNFEPPPASPDAGNLVFNAGTVWQHITANTSYPAGGGGPDVNLRVTGSVVLTITGGGSVEFGHLELLNGAVLTHEESTFSTPGTSLELTARSLFVDAASRVDVSGRGFPGGRSSGNPSLVGMAETGGSTYASGGSHGGRGGTHSGTGASGPTYGFLDNPTHAGGGGSAGNAGQSGGDGGGVIRMEVPHVAADGGILADGRQGSGGFAGSGAGGAVFLDVRAFSGSGLVTANGAGDAEGGGGGRIFIRSRDLFTKDTTLIRALGGDGAFSDGGVGTVYFETGGQRDVVVDGTTFSTQYTTLPTGPGFQLDNLILRNRARIEVTNAIVALGEVRILSGSTLRHRAEQESGLLIQADSIHIDSTSSIDVSGMGYPGGNAGSNVGNPFGRTLNFQPGPGYLHAGSHGGVGGRNPNAVSDSLTYGLPWNPIHLGAGGASGNANQSGGSGGGRVTLEAARLVRVDGAIRANGGPTAAAGFASSGAGGSIWIKTPRLEGTGTVQANGFGDAQGGGGGRVALEFAVTDPDGDLNDFRNVQARGGDGAFANGSPGTVWIKRPFQAHGDVIVDNGQSNHDGTYLPFMPLGYCRVTGVSNLTVDLSAHLPVLPGALVGARWQPRLTEDVYFTITANTATSITVNASSPAELAAAAPVGARGGLRHRLDNLWVRGAAGVVSADGIELTGEFRLEERAVWTHAPSTASFFSGFELEADSVFIASNCFLNVSGRGCPGGYSSGNPDQRGLYLDDLPGSPFAAGGSHAGLGGRPAGYPAPNPVYGDPRAPVENGAGGCGGNGGQPGGHGGGRVKINAREVVVDGTVAADGSASFAGFAGSGAGGSVWMRAESISGGGVIRCNGIGDAEGGGGGRVALEAATIHLSIPNHQVQARGGDGAYADGGHGSIYLRTNAAPDGLFWVDGGGFVAPLDSTVWVDAGRFNAIRFTRGARVVSSHPLEVTEDLEVTANSLLAHPREWEAGLSIQADAVLVDATSSIDVSARGYAGGYSGSQTGIGAGKAKPPLSGSTYRSGGSHGGVGGRVEGTPNAAYGSARQPSDLGSGGCGGSGGERGGYGGGRLRIQASTLTLEGALRADGETGFGGYSGSGSGGSVWITADDVVGAGSITANGAPDAEGGGGGRIAIEYTTLAHGLDQIQARGGNGAFADGGHGTIYLKDSLEVDRLIVDGGGFAAPADSSPYPDLGSMLSAPNHVLLRRGARVVSTNAVHATDTVVLEQNATLTHPHEWVAGLEIAGASLSVDATSAIDVSGRGHAGGFSGSRTGIQMGAVPAALSGQGTTYRAGASHGGFGGRLEGQTNPAYGDAYAPDALGAGGAGGSGGQSGGYGGGKLYLSVPGNLVLDGTIAANGAPGTGGFSGSGAGGSIRISTAGALSGAGFIRADGAGDAEGSGGGRIAIQSASLGLTLDQITARGGVGAYARGGPGTIFLSSSVVGRRLIVDAHGLPVGDSTPLPISQGHNLDEIVLRRGVRAVTTHVVEATVIRLELNSSLTHPHEFAPGLTLRGNSLSLDETSSLDVSGRGYPGGQTGSQAGNPRGKYQGGDGSTYRSGGSHGGLGGFIEGTPNPIYGDANAPVTLGAGGCGGAGLQAGGYGGGAIRIEVSQLGMNIGSAIRANGTPGSGGYSGSGAGGSIWITAADLSGSGLIEANGAGDAEGGGGGRIAVYYTFTTSAGISLAANFGTGAYAAGSPGSVVYQQALGAQTPGGTGTGHESAALRVARIEVLPGGRMKVFCSGDRPGCRVFLEKAGHSDAPAWLPLGDQAADGSGVVFEIPSEPGVIFLRLRMQ